jgi:hypothetical protein
MVKKMKNSLKMFEVGAENKKSHRLTGGFWNKWMEMN